MQAAVSAFVGRSFAASLGGLDASCGGEGTALAFPEAKIIENFVTQWPAKLRMKGISTLKKFNYESNI